MKSHFLPFILMVSFLFQFVFSIAQNEKPIAVNDTLIFHSPGVYTIHLLDNDYDPDGDSIYLDHIYDDVDGLDITVIGDQLEISPIHFGHYHGRLEYRIRDLDGRSDKADIVVLFIQHPDAALLVADTILVDNQVSIDIDLLENDIYNGSEELKIISTSSWYQGDFEILPDSHSVRFVSDAYNGPDTFGYTLMEKGGNQYVSNGGGFIFVYKNENAPIARSDTFEVQAGQVHFLDVLSNDMPSNKIEVNALYTENESFSIEDFRIKFDVPEGSKSVVTILYDIINTENQLKSIPVKSVIYVLPSPNKPTAIADTVEFVYSGEAVELFPLANDVNPAGNSLVIHETGTDRILFENTAGSGWFKKQYFCKDTITGLFSSEQNIHIHVLPPDSIQVTDQYIDYTMGELIDIDPFEGTNIVDAILFSVRPQIGTYEHQNQTYTFDIRDFEGLLHNEWKNIYQLNDTIEIKFDFKEGYHHLYIRKYVYINYKPSQFYTDLNINNINLTLSPNGFHFGDIKYPGNTVNRPISMIHPWMSDYTNQQIKRVSGNINYYDGADFVYGPLSDDYSANYGLDYYRTWKVSRMEVLYHKYHWFDQDYQIPENILSWPSQKTLYNGNLYEGADFIDANNNGEYDPENGDYPKITGDEAVLFIVNDGRYGNSGEGIPLDSLNVDLYAMVYAFNRPESEYFNNTFFIKYKVVNKSSNNYEDFKFGLYADSDYSFNDSYSSNRMAIGCDTLLNTFYSYPAVNINPVNSPWPIKPPICLFSILNQNLDKFTQVVSTGGGYDAWDNYSPQKKYHYLNGTWDYNMFSPHPSWASNAPLDFVYPSSPMEFGGDNFLSKPSNAYYNDGQMLGSSGSHTLMSGESLIFEYAIQFYNNQESGWAESIDDALNSVAQLIECYENDSVPGGGSFTGIEQTKPSSSLELLLYPNPALRILYIEGANNAENYAIYTLQGQMIEESVLRNKEISIEHLAKGFYLLQIRDVKGEKEWTTKFVKQ